MAETELNDVADSAEKAYAQASAKVEAAPAEQAEPEFTPAPALVAEVSAPEAKPVESKPAAAAPTPAKRAAAKAKAPVAKKPRVAKRAAVAKKSPAAKVGRPRRAAAVKAAPVKSVAPKAAKPKPRVVKPVAANLSVIQLKDKIMATKKNTTDFTENFKSVVADAQGKAKVAYDKGSAVFGEATEFTKGNVEALVESTKILGSGLQELTSGYVAESRSAFETLTADVKALAAVKSPTDFFRLQSEIMRRNFDKAVTFGSKNSEAVLKLTSEVAAPIQGRVNLAVEKVKLAA